MMTKENLRSHHHALIAWCQQRQLTLGEAAATCLSVASVCLARIADNDEQKLQREVAALSEIFARAATDAFLQERNRQHAQH